MPALCAVMSGFTIRAGGTFRKRIPTRSRTSLTRTPEKKAVIHRPTGMKYMNTINPNMISAISIRPEVVKRDSMGIGEVGGLPAGRAENQLVDGSDFM